MIIKWLLWKGILTLKSMSRLSSVLLLFSGLTTLLFFCYHSWQPSLFLCLIPLESNAFSSEGKLDKAQKLEGVQNRKEGEVYLPSQTVTAASPLLHTSHQSCLSSSLSKPPLSLWSVSIPSAFTFLSVPSYPSYCLGGDCQNETFSGGKNTEHARIPFLKKEESEQKEEGCSWNIEGDCCSPL